MPFSRNIKIGRLEDSLLMDFTIERAAERRMKMTQKGLLNRQTNGEEECGDYENEKKIF